MSRLVRWCKARPLPHWAFTFIALAAVLAPRPCRAEEAPSVVKYGLDGFWTGAQIGLAAGYIATGSDYESHEWRKLAFGAGVGALSGLGLGLTLGIVDVSSQPPATGWLVLRDIGYGTGLGALAGTAVGALFLIDSGEPKDLLTGAAIGALVGAGAGAVFGVIEGASASKKRERNANAALEPGVRMRLTVTTARGSGVLMPALAGEF